MRRLATADDPWHGTRFFVAFLILVMIVGVVLLFVSIVALSHQLGDVARICDPMDQPTCVAD